MRKGLEGVWGSFPTRQLSSPRPGRGADHGKGLPLVVCPMLRDHGSGFLVYSRARPIATMDSLWSRSVYPTHPTTKSWGVQKVEHNSPFYHASPVVS